MAPVHAAQKDLARFPASSYDTDVMLQRQEAEARLSKAQDRARECARKEAAEAAKEEASKDSAELASRCPTREEFEARQTARKDADAKVPLSYGVTDKAQEEYTRLKAESVRAQARYDRVVAAMTACQQHQGEEDAQLLQNNPKAMQLVLSLNLCMRQQHERGTLEQIQKEKQNSKIAGVVDLLALKQLQDDVVGSRKAIKAYRDAISELKLEPLSCDAAPVKALWDCAAATATDCDAPEVQFLLRAQRKLDDLGDG